jgi:AcrR family transcriptional regulator
MNNEHIKERILQNAGTLFCAGGFNGTSIRDIAKAAECSLPMLYYYYENKQALYKEIVMVEMQKIHEKLNNEIPRDLRGAEIYKYYCSQRLNLSAYDRAVYALSYKAHLHFEGDEEIWNHIDAWLQNRYARNQEILVKYCKDKENAMTITAIFLKYIEKTVQQIILQGIGDKNTIDKEIDYYFKMIQ